MKQFKQIREAVAGAPTRSVYDSQSGKYKTEPIGSQTTPATGTKPAEPGREAQAGRFVSARPKLPTKPTPQVTSEDIERVEEVRKMASGGRDNAGGQHYDIDNGDGTIGFGYKPGKSHPSSSHSNYEYKPEPKHPLHGKLVTAKHSNGQEVTGRMMGTEHQGTVAKIKHSSGVIHSTDAKTVKKANSGIKEDIERIEEMDKSQTPPGRDGGYQFAPGPKVSKKDIEAVKKNPAKHLSDLFAKHYAKKKMKEEVEQIEEKSDEAYNHYKKQVLPIYKKHGLSPEFAKAVNNHVAKHGSYQVWNHHGDAEGQNPHWFDSEKQKVKPIKQKRSYEVSEEVEQIEEGRPSQRHPLEGHEYHKKTDAELVYIAKDAHKAAEAMKTHNTTAENKYRDQANDSATVRYFRQKNGMPDWYKKKYGHMKEEVVAEEVVDEEVKDEYARKVDKYLKKKYGKDDSQKKLPQGADFAAARRKERLAKSDRMDEGKDPKEYGYEGDMAMNQLQTIMRHAEYLMDMMKPDTDLPEWVQSKITLAADYIQTSCDYMTSEMKEEVMDEGKDPLPRETTKDGGSWVKDTKTATHYSGKKTYEYKKFDKEGKETGERHYRDAQGNHMGEAVETPPFAGPYKKPVGNVKDKSGAVHTPMSRAKDLAKKAARRQAGLKEENDKNDVDSQGFEKTNTPAKRTLSKTAGMVKDMAKSSKSKEKKAAPEKFEPEPELASAINR